MKKLFCCTLSFLLIFLPPVSAWAGSEAAEYEEEIIYLSNETDSELTIEEIDELIQTRTMAYLFSDFELAENITDILYQNGMEEISLAEICQITDYDGEITVSDSGATFETIYGSYTSSGVTYQTMRIYATPSTGSNLYKSGVTTKKNSSSAAANVMKFISISSSAAAGIYSDSLGVVLTVYSALKSLVSQLSATTTITNISASYTWAVAETCVFIYIKNSSGSWSLSAQYSKASASVTAVVPTLEYGSDGAIADTLTKKYTGSITPNNYNSMSKAVSAFINGGIYSSARINKIIIKGISGKTVKSVSLLNPYYPASIT